MIFYLFHIVAIAYMAKSFVAKPTIFPYIIRRFTVDKDHIEKNFCKDVEKCKDLTKCVPIQFATCKNERTAPHKNVNETKLISISPGGLKGFYMLGTTAYIKEHYSLDHFIYSGASAGAWNALFMTFKGESLELILDVLECSKKAISIMDLEYMIKYQMLQKYKTEDFDLHKLHIGVTNLESMKIKTNIYSNFTNIEDAIDCCIASSHIPYITGGFTNVYHNVYSFDGGFSRYPYVSHIPPVLHITPSIWKDKNVIKKRNWMNFSTYIHDYTTLFSKDKYDFTELFDQGYDDARRNKERLDSLIYR